MTRVLVDGAVYGWQAHGGISRYFTQILNRIADNYEGIEVILHVPCRNGALPNAGPRLRLVRDWRLRPMRVFRPTLRKLGQWKAMRFRPDIFHSTYYTMPYCSKLPSVVTVHDMIHERYPALTGDESFPQKKRHVIEAADAIIAVSETTKQDVLEYAPVDEEKITVVHHAPSHQFTLPATDEEIGRFLETRKLRRPYWIYVGDRNGYKNFGRLIRALPSAFARTDAQLVAVGGEPALAQWEIDFLARQGMEQRVSVLTGLDDEELRTAYSAAAALVLPSLAEGFGIPILEAMAAGTPVICSDIPVFREVAGDAALYFDPHNEEALAQRMLEALDADTRNAYGEMGRTWVNKYSWDRAASATAEIYERVAAG